MTVRHQSTRSAPWWNQSFDLISHPLFHCLTPFRGFQVTTACLAVRSEVGWSSKGLISLWFSSAASGSLLHRRSTTSLVKHVSSSVALGSDKERCVSSRCTYLRQSESSFKYIRHAHYPWYQSWCLRCLSGSLRSSSLLQADLPKTLTEKIRGEIIR